VTGPISFLLNIYIFVLLAHVIFSWVPRPPEPLMPFVVGVRRLVEPLLTPLRRVIPSVPIGGVRLDLSIIVLFIATRILIGVFASMGL
jgi:YggT family protein